MGFFDFILKGLGFESGEPKQKKEKKVKEPTASKRVLAGAGKFDLKAAAQPALKPQSRATDLAQSNGFANNSFAKEQTVATTTMAMPSANIATFSPSTFEEAKGIIDFVRKRLPAIVNMANLTDLALRQKAIEFLSGAMYAMRGKFEMLSETLYLATPDGAITK